MSIAAHKASDKPRRVALEALARRPNWKEFLSCLQGNAHLGAPIPHYRIKSVADSHRDAHSNAKQIGWYLPIVGGKTLGTVHLLKTRAGLVFSGISEDRIPRRLIEAVRIAEKSLAHHGKNLELRFLDAPALLFCAVWLHGRDGTDLFVSLSHNAESIVESDLQSDLCKLMPSASGNRRRLKKPLGRKSGMAKRVPAHRSAGRIKQKSPSRPEAKRP